jgi:hypothetical protein
MTVGDDEKIYTTMSYMHQVIMELSGKNTILFLNETGFQNSNEHLLLIQVGSLLVESLP